MSNFISPDQMPVQGLESPTPGFTRDSVHALIRPAIEKAFLEMAPSDFDTTATFDDLHLVTAHTGSVRALLDAGLSPEELDEKLEELATFTANDRINYVPNNFGVTENNGIFTVLASSDPLTRERIKGAKLNINRIMGGNVAHVAKKLPLAKFDSEREANIYFAQIAKLYNNSMRPEEIPLAVFGGVKY